jgi:hypothetical protein
MTEQRGRFDRLATRQQLGFALLPPRQSWSEDRQSKRQGLPVLRIEKEMQPEAIGRLEDVATLELTAEQAAE